MNSQVSETRSPKLKRNFSSSAGLTAKIRAQNTSMSSLHSGTDTGTLNRHFTSVSNLVKRQPAKMVSKKRIATPIKVKGGGYHHTIIDDDEDDGFLQNLTKEIEELRAKRLSHDLYKKNSIEDDDDEDFETAFLADTLLGELGSSQGSHRDPIAENENDNDEPLEGDSGASDG